LKGERGKNSKRKEKKEKRKGKAKMRCPSCDSKISVDLKTKECSCHQCGWHKTFGK
jgi:ribosomal protein L37AE/L43A